MAFYDGEVKRLSHVGRLDHEGFAEEEFWISTRFPETNNVNNGFLYGELDTEGTMTGKKPVIMYSCTQRLGKKRFCVFALLGEDIAFIYPDLKTALFGLFHKNMMVEARHVKIVAEKCVNGIKRVKFSKPNMSSPTFTLVFSDSLCCMAFIRDFVWFPVTIEPPT